MNYIKISLGIFLALAVTRFIPHPPNFTSLIALSFYVPALFGLRYLPALVLSFLITDIFFGFHNTLLFTWGSVVFIGFLSKYFTSSIYFRMFGAMTGSLCFYLITNFGVWSLGYYSYSMEGLIMSYTLALPFFGYNLISTFLFSAIIETFYKLKKIYLIKKQTIN